VPGIGGASAWMSWFRYRESFAEITLISICNPIKEFIQRYKTLSKKNYGYYSRSCKGREGFE
jgi:hypothetical protein